MPATGKVQHGGTLVHVCIRRAGLGIPLIDILGLLLMTIWARLPQQPNQLHRQLSPAALTGSPTGSPHRQPPQAAPTGSPHRQPPQAAPTGSPHRLPSRPHRLDKLLWSAPCD